MTVTKGDTLTDFIRIDLNNNTDKIITKMVVQIGVVIREYNAPVYPILLSLSSDESKLLSHKNSVDIAVYYGDNNKHTAKGVAEFYADPERIY